jgi:uncharacterized protein (UPF0335 family)
MSETIFLKENEKDIFQALQEQGIDTKVFEHRLAHLFNRVYNNYVGYYVFKQDAKIYKLIVLPKTIKKSDQAEKAFVNYLLHYYRLNAVYSFDEEKQVSNSLLSLAFEKNNEEKKSHKPLDEFEFYKYGAILEAIEKFFKRHKNYKRIQKDYVSQSVKYKLNLKRNIKELDKTKIHQTQREDVVYSIMATVTFNALKLFLAHRLEHLEESYKTELIQETNRLKNFLLKKYNIDKGYNLTLANLQGFKIEKIFSKTDETKHLLVGIKSLFGFEQMYNDNVVSVENRYDLETTSLFIDPIKFYEWYVYDILKKYADANGKTIEFDKQEKTTTLYHINQHKKSSNPDYILTDKEQNIKIVIDAKWKNVNKFGDIESSDYLKLKFDTFLLEKKGYGIIPYLIYPNIGIEERKFNMLLDESSIFNFNTLEVDMEFEKHGNSLEFDFDIQSLQESIEQERKIEEHKSMAETLSSKMATQRTSILSQLIDEEDNEKREKLKAQLDNELQILGLKLSERLEEQELLPEIAEILKLYDDVLEDESKKFLKSSSFIYSYYKDKRYEHFDYSMPGSGFWKLIELELNTSFVWQVRIGSRVCDNSSPWKNISVPNQKVSQRIERGNNVILNKSEIDNELILQGIMLGGIRTLCLDNSTLNQFFNDFFSSNEIFKIFVEDKLVLLIEKISKLRNEYAHIKAMSLEKFEELWDTLFRENEGKKSVLKKLLEFKKSLNEDR